MTYTVKYRRPHQSRCRKLKKVRGERVKPEFRALHHGTDNIRFFPHDTLIILPPVRESLLPEGQRVAEDKKESPYVVHYRLHGDRFFRKLKNVVWYSAMQYSREFLLEDNTRVCVPHNAEIEFPPIKQASTGGKISDEIGQPIQRAT